MAHILTDFFTMSYNDTIYIFIIDYSLHKINYIISKWLYSNKIYDCCYCWHSYCLL